MVLFYSNDITADGRIRLGDEESTHCVRVMRHRIGDEICIIDGAGTMFRCRLEDDNPKAAVASVLQEERGWGSHQYFLTVGVCPTKNPERFEWFAQKATEMGIDRISPLEADHSERRVFKGARLSKILLSATKQSLKSKVPVLDEMRSVGEWIGEFKLSSSALKLIACCYEDESHPRISITRALREFKGDEIAVLIGPEGDFSHEELFAALDAGFIPVHIGASRLRTETAALAAVCAVYLNRI